MVTAILGAGCLQGSARSPSDEDEEDAGAPGTSMPPTLVDQVPPAPPPPPLFGRN
ncbi:MAG TPA: hypothetical protein VLM85_20910 [Polyangiaceae bacterium]|nr:hypothetical protein [Polyangiaceae bacterium]